MRLLPKVGPSNRCAVVAQLSRNRLARALITRALLGTKGLRRWAAGKRRLPARQFLVAALGIGVPKAVGVFDARIADLALVAMELLFVVLIRWDQRAASGKFPDLLEESPLLVTQDRHGSGTAALGPAGLELDVIVLDRVIG